MQIQAQRKLQIYVTLLIDTVVLVASENMIFTRPFWGSERVPMRTGVVIGEVDALILAAPTRAARVFGNLHSASVLLPIDPADPISQHRLSDEPQACVGSPEINLSRVIG